MRMINHNNSCCVSATSARCAGNAYLRAGVAATGLSAMGALLATLNFAPCRAASAPETPAGASHEFAVWVPMPDPFAGVKIKMNLLEPAGPRPGLAAHWKRVDLLGDRELLEAAADCELIEQIAQKILPLLSVRNVDYHATCQANLLPGAVQLKADVLVADQGSVPGAGQSSPTASAQQ